MLVGFFLSTTRLLLIIKLEKFVAEKEGPLEMYRGMVARGSLQHDARQESVAEALDHLLVKLKEHNRQMKDYQVLHSLSLSQPWMVFLFSLQN